MKQAGFTLLFLISLLRCKELDWQPETHRFMVTVKGSYSKDRAEDETIPFWAIQPELRLNPLYFDFWGGGYFQMRLPASLYHFPTKDAVTCEFRLRPDLGPPIASWTPLGMVDISYSYSSKDWFSHRNEPLHSMLIGGWFQVPLRIPDDGIFMVAGGKSVLGDKMPRFSCYFHWFFSKHFGLTVHGDNFIREYENQRFHYGSFNAGVLFRI